MFYRKELEIAILTSGAEVAPQESVAVTRDRLQISASVLVLLVSVCICLFHSCVCSYESIITFCVWAYRFEAVKCITESIFNSCTTQFKSVILYRNYIPPI